MPNATLNWTLDEDDVWRAETPNGDELFVEEDDGQWVFSWRGPDAMAPPMVNFDDYYFEAKDDAKEAVILHNACFGKSDQFDVWYQKYREDNDD